MTQYLKDGPFSVALGSEKYRDNWEQTFGKKRKEPPMTDKELLERTIADFKPEALKLFVKMSNGMGLDVKVNFALALYDALLEERHSDE